MTHDDMIAVIQAYKDGKQIQRRTSNGEWLDLENPMWYFNIGDYRVKPEEPKLVPHWPAIFENSHGTFITSRLYKDFSQAKKAGAEPLRLATEYPPIMLEVKE